MTGDETTDAPAPGADEYVIAAVDEIGEGERVVAQIAGREVGVFNVDGELFAYTNWCAHQGGPCCEGRLTGTQTAEYDRDRREITLEWAREGEILSCPWHGWEYDVTSGTCLSKPQIRLPSHEVSIRDGAVVVSL